MKKFLLSFCLLWGVVNSANTQEKISEIQFEARKSAGVRCAPFTENEYLYIAVVDLDRLTRFLVDIKNKTIDSFSEPNNMDYTLYSGNDTILAGLASKGNTLQLIRNQFYNRLYFEYIDFQSKTSKIEEFKIKKEKFIGATVSNGNIIIVTHPKDSEKINFYFKTINEPPVLKTVNIHPQEYKEGGFVTTYSNPIENFKIMDKNSSDDVEILCSKSKIFFDPENIIILDNTNPGVAQVTRINKVSWEQNTKKYDFDFLDDSKKRIYSNSYYRNEHLFNVALNNNKFGISIFDLLNDRSVKTFTASLEDSISFKNGPIKQEGGGDYYSKNRQLELSSNEQFFRKLENAGNFFISVRRQDNMTIEILTGSFKIRSTSYGSYVGPSGRTAPSIFTKWSMWSKSIFFSGLYEEKTFNHIPGEISPPLFETIESFRKDLSGLRYSSSFSSTSSQFIVHCDTKNDKLVIYKFEE